ncbi:hypothetical protein LENED_006223 [Lentinula edodes]|uniref:Uncharacterized protein n=1 Tax=Lentinula edodes TaxID=5353 RepID=A0A1Q3EBG1_LENED|nr:hypothetical protein LENED_006223 [Lentinula edodes]
MKFQYIGPYRSYCPDYNTSSSRFHTNTSSRIHCLLLLSIQRLIQSFRIYLIAAYDENITTCFLIHQKPCIQAFS